ncbi:hypothetical protein [uncultured Methanobrevibacter sp.]|uniref:hypothetical protein n=1 Tax=uncultured Methanobrevibacter sp. TaxID=253161 RepID=UPI0025F931CC|nr:hypothetical protein [uncultured Methanobrevibacter sp.]MEE1133888.1 hypothetical protein [Methanobrevibacter sp.]MEE3490706.1 hypothetical protein [Methanobrevibacter sp.]
MTHAFIPQHLIDLAEYLNSKNFSDNTYDLQCIDRTIINRAYLSTYLHTHDWIINNGHYNDIKNYSKNDIGYHTAICIALNKLNEKTISKKYAEFIELRVDADYNIVTIITSKDAQKALDLASQIQNALQ